MKIKLSLNTLKSILKPYSSILFLENKIAGFVILIITFINPSVAISGICAVFFTYFFAKLLNMKDEYLTRGFYAYNSLLVGMGIGFIFLPSLTSIILIAIASSFTFMFSFVLDKLFSVYKIPILSLPFSVVIIFMYLASFKYSNLLSNLVNNATIYDISLPLVLSGFLKSFGTIFFLPNNIAGILLLLVVLYYSRIIFIMSIAGFYVGVGFNSFLIGSYEQALQNAYAFNYILTAIALGGIFLLPTIKNMFLAMIGVLISVVLVDATQILFSYYGIPIFTIPFNLTTITFIFILSAIYYKEFNYNIKETPEKSLQTYLSNVFRFGDIQTKISLPFLGNWSVYQGFNGKWTHKGEYKYAYDFVKIKNKKSYGDDGLYCTDYYCFGKPVLSPVNGYIVNTRDDLDDNLIGDVDRVNNWGNYIIIKSDLGFFVKICHLMQHSLSHKTGEYVNTSQVVAKCGNSGYSPQPHIHIQAQYLGVIGAITKKFCFKEYIQNNKLIFNGLPSKNSKISAVVVDKSIASRLSFVLEDKFKYDVYEYDNFKEKIKFKVKMNKLGEFFLEDKHQNALFFYNDETQFYFYNYIGNESYLKKLFKISPRFPFVNKANVVFNDFLPANLVKNKFQEFIIQLISIFNKNNSKIGKLYKCQDDSIISEYGKVELEQLSKGFGLIQYDAIKLKKT